ncbi:hypothetical protein [Spirosoma rhododendri]|uniref:Uncharacterized protein n=1 Tax=Spirosoma rhododendri TaxID=2728024 RepID=A0A7L5DLM7_9BACT|nr:hypothetical protein [Spirosoma rhododendri]QJD79015.1 hypothetical protein HH216_11710 [Spirosoma rhododendri]
MSDEQDDYSMKDAQIAGKQEQPLGTDGSDQDRANIDNKHRESEENSANGLDSETVVGGQDGRNNRGIGSTDMDSENGLLRMNDMDDSQMQVTDEGMESATSGENRTNTSTVDVTTSGPDDYASADEVGTPDAEVPAKEQADEDDEGDPDNTQPTGNDEADEEQISQIGTDLDNQPAY